MNRILIFNVSFGLLLILDLIIHMNMLKEDYHIALRLLPIKNSEAGDWQRYLEIMKQIKTESEEIGGDFESLL